MKQLRILRLIPDKLYLKILYRYHFKKAPNLKEPRGFNEKMQWLKIHDRKKEYIVMVDKYLAKEYVGKIIGQEYINPTIGVWDDARKIDFNSLPDSFVLKCNHNSGGLVICKNKSELDKEKAIEKLNKSLKNNGFWYGREWPYKNVKPLIIAEPYLEDSETKELRDYKFFCFDGVPTIMFVGSERQTNDGVKFDFFDMNFARIKLTNGHPNSSLNDEELMPHHFQDMVSLAKKLSKNMPFLRVDFYEVNGKIYFGELTLYHGSGCLPFDPVDWDLKLGSLLKLPNLKK